MGNCCFPEQQMDFPTILPHFKQNKYTMKTKSKNDSADDRLLAADKYDYDSNKLAPQLLLQLNEEPRSGSYKTKHSLPNIVVTTPGGTNNNSTAAKKDQFQKMDEINIPCVNLTDFMIEKMKEHGDKTALVDSATEKAFTYSEVIVRIKYLAKALRNRGLQKEDIVCMCSPNSIDYAVVFYAVIALGAVLQPISTQYTIEEMKRTFKETGTRYVITTQGLQDKLREAAAPLYIEQNIILIDGNSENSLGGFIAIGQQIEGEFMDVQIDPKQTVAALLSTSGTTGFPKSAQMSHYGVISIISQLEFTLKQCCFPGDVSIVFLPMYHMFGLCVVLSLGLVQGLKLVVMSRFYPQEYLKNIEVHKAKILHLVPPVMSLLAKHPMVSNYNLSTLKRIICGAAPLSPDIAEKVQERLGVERILEGYGMTELGVPFVNTRDHFKYGSVGRKVPMVEYKIMNSEAEEVGINIKGEIWIKGPQVFLGYMNNPESTRDTLTKDGWVRSGDIGYVDKDGFLYIVDRIKELIKYKGHQVPPAQLDNILLEHPCIDDVAVVGVADEEAGEVPKAYIVKKHGVSITEDEAANFLSLRVAPHMRLRGGVEFVDEIPKSPTGKILRRKLQTQSAFTFEKCDV